MKTLENQSWNNFMKELAEKYDNQVITTYEFLVKQKEATIENRKHFIHDKHLWQFYQKAALNYKKSLEKISVFEAGQPAPIYAQGR